MIKKIAYLTIDDAPSTCLKEKVDYLYNKKIPAIFFCEGERMQKRIDLVEYAINKGFIIGNHAWDHPYFSNLSLENCFKQIKDTDNLINKIYKKAGRKRPANYFRFPYGDKGGNQSGDDYENEIFLAMTE